MTERVLAAVSDATTPQGVAAVASKPDAELSSLGTAPSLVLVLAEVADPGNAGTLVRSAAAAGADAVVFTEGSVDPWGPKTVRASAAALFGLPVITGVSLLEAIEALKERGLSLYAAEAGKGTPVYDVDLTRPCALVLGNEAHGIPRGESERFTGYLSIPMPGGTESLNVATAGSILMYEVVRQRTTRPG